jgi:hypothetical protein
LRNREAFDYRRSMNPANRRFEIEGKRLATPTRFRAGR